MGDNTETNNQVLGEGFAIEANDTEDVLIFMPTSESQILGVKVSIEVCCEIALEDKRCDMLIDLTEAITQTMVGRYKLFKKAHMQEYKGTLRLTDRGVMEVS